MMDLKNLSAPERKVLMEMSNGRVVRTINSRALRGLRLMHGLINHCADNDGQYRISPAGWEVVHALDGLLR